MKVAMLGWEFPPFIAGGLGIHCLELTRRLSQAGVEIDFYMPDMPLAGGAARVADVHKHVQIRPVRADPGVGPYDKGYDSNFNRAVELYNQRLVQEFDSTDADVLHAHDWITIPAGLALRRRTGKPLVLTMHSLEHDRSAGFFPQPWIESIERRGVRQADHVIAVSNYTRQLLIDKYGADPTKVTAIHNGVDWTKFTRPIHHEYGAHHNILFLSRVSRQKGPLYFMGAARRVLERRPDLRFAVVGKGEMLPECIDYAVRHRIADHVSFSGYVPEGDLTRIYGQSDVYVLPSVSEPFGISILEAMACGVPSIVSRTTGAAEAISHVLKCDFWDTDEMADLILRLAESPEMAQELGQNGAREVRKFTWSRCALKTIGVYEHVQRPAPTATPLEDPPVIAA